MYSRHSPHAARALRGLGDDSHAAFDTWKDLGHQIFLIKTAGQVVPADLQAAFSAAQQALAQPGTYHPTQNAAGGMNFLDDGTVVDMYYGLPTGQVLSQDEMAALLNGTAQPVSVAVTTAVSSGAAPSPVVPIIDAATNQPVTPRPVTNDDASTYATPSGDAPEGGAGSPTLVPPDAPTDLNPAPSSAPTIPAPTGAPTPPASGGPSTLATLGLVALLGVGGVLATRRRRGRATRSGRRRAR